MNWLDRLLAVIAQESPAPARGATGSAAPGLSAVPTSVAVAEADVSPPESRMIDAAPLPGTADAGRRDERERLLLVREELARLAPWGPVTVEALDALRRHFDARWQSLAAPTPVRPDAAALPGPSPAAGPSLQEFLSEHSILIVSYVGAFLLIVATLLFELYGAGALSGPVRFAAVLTLDLAFGAAGWWCLRRPSLRLVGTTYVAIFALMAPLVFVAAYVFLVLREYGITPHLAQAVAGSCCAALYGVLAWRLRSAGYALLSLLALPVGWIGAINALDLGPWGGVALAPLMVVYSAIRRATAGRTASTIPSAATTLEVFVHSAAVAAIYWTLLGIGTASPYAARTSGADRWTVTAGLAAVTLAYLAHSWLSRRWDSIWLPAAMLTLAAVSGNASARGSQTGAAVALVGLAWLYAAAARRLPSPRWAAAPAWHILRLLAAVQVVACIALRASPDWAQAGILLAGSLLGVLLALDTAAPWWLLLTGLVFSIDWYWLVKAVVPPPPRANAGTLLLAYGPLPVVWALAGLGVRAMLKVRRAAPAGATADGEAAVQQHPPGIPGPATPRPQWSLPLYVAAAVNASWIVAGAYLNQDFALLGRLLLVYALLSYAVGLVERFAPAASAGAIALAAGLLSLLHAGGAPLALYPLVGSATCWLIYGAGLFWAPRLARDDGALAADSSEMGATPPAVDVARASAASRPAETLPLEWRREHRIVALVGAVLIAAWCFSVPQFNRIGDGGALASLVALWSCALMGFVDSRRQRAFTWEYVAGIAAALGTYWIASYFGATNPQWYVVVPGLWCIATSQLLRHDSRIAQPASPSRWLATLGTAALLLTTASQAVGGEGLDALYTAALVLEAIALLLAGIALRDRTLVLGAAAAIAFGAFRALFLILQQVPLYVVFGVAALVLLGLGAALAALRERVAGVRAAIFAWRDWG